MFSSGELNNLLEQIVSQFGQGMDNSTKATPVKSTGGYERKQTNKKKAPAITPHKALVIFGLLAGVLEVKSVMIDRDQIINILLDGSLKRKTRLDKMLDEIGDMPFDEVLGAIMGRVFGQG